MTMTGDKGSIMKLAGMTGHADFVKDGTYEIEESVAVELPKTIKLDEGLTIAQRFAKLM